MEEIVVLTGFMGAGKSSTGRALADLLGWGFADLDEEIEGDAGKTVERIFAEDGEARFRELETEALERVLGRRRVVVAAGGGVLLRERNRFLLAGRKVFYLHASPEECLRRVRGSPVRRPLLEVADPSGAAERIYRERAHLYEATGRRVETEGRTAEEVAGAIAKALGRGSGP